MISAGDFKNGLTFEKDGKLMQVIEFQHVKPGKGAPFVRAKIKNLIDGGITECSFNPTDKFQDAFIDRHTVQYSYTEGNVINFMDLETYETIPIEDRLIGENVKFLKEGMEVSASCYKGNVFKVELPTFVVLKVTSADPGVKGDTATNTMKIAVLETGAEIKVPLFVNPGDYIKIDTREGKYVERSKG